MPQEDEVVRRAPLFTALDDAQAASLRASMDSVKIAKGGILFKEGDEGEHVYVIVDGKLKLGTSSGDGRENLLSILGPGEMFGELSLFDPGPRTSTATAVTDAKLLSLSHEKLIPWLIERDRLIASGMSEKDADKKQTNRFLSKEARIAQEELARRKSFLSSSTTGSSALGIIDAAVAAPRVVAPPSNPAKASAQKGNRSTT